MFHCAQTVPSLSTRATAPTAQSFPMLFPRHYMSTWYSPCGTTTTGIFSAPCEHRNRVSTSHWGWLNPSTTPWGTWSAGEWSSMVILDRRTERFWTGSQFLPGFVAQPHLQGRQGTFPCQSSHANLLLCSAFCDHSELMDTGLRVLLDFDNRGICVSAYTNW